MTEKTQSIFDKIKAINESSAAVEVEKINFYPMYRDICKQNSCGAYGKNYTCPPLVGELDDCIARLKKYNTGIVFRRAYPLEDSFDVEGMDEASKSFEKLTREIFKLMKESGEDFLILSAGGCKFCPKCGAADNIPCRSPENAIASLESYGIQVSELAGQVGMKYISGSNTVTYFGGVFIND